MYYRAYYSLLLSTTTSTKTKYFPDRHDSIKCVQCSGVHQHEMEAAGCNNIAITTYCHGDAPPTGDVHFPGSSINDILNNATWGESVNTWAKKPAAQVWDLCYSSLTATTTTRPSSTSSATRIASR